MANATIINATYDLTAIMSKDAINDPPKWLALLNNAVGGWIIVTFVAVFGIAIWMILKNNGYEDSEAIAYSGVLCTIISVLLFVIQITALPSVKLMTWAQVVPFFVITAVVLFVNYVRRQY